MTLDIEPFSLTSGRFPGAGASTNRRRPQLLPTVLKFSVLRSGVNKEKKIISRTPFGYNVDGNQQMPKRVPNLVEQLKAAIRDSGLPLNQIEKASGVGREQLSRFLRNERTLTLPAVSALCEALGYTLAKIDPPKPARKPKGGK
jgi:DNA-binding phage protein